MPGDARLIRAERATWDDNLLDWRLQHGLLETRDLADKPVEILGVPAAPSEETAMPADSPASSRIASRSPIAAAGFLRGADLPPIVRIREQQYAARRYPDPAMAEPTPPSAPTPSPEDKQQVEALVADCIEAMERGEPDPAARACATRPGLLTHVQRRLAQLAQRGLIPSTDQLPPQTIGPYRIRRELGSGGMGTVYLAEQSEPVRRDVALKAIKLGMNTREVVARFQAERHALALMNHPYIAQVFDAGITADGRPYFVMEYVAGQPLTTFCDKRSFSPEQRIQLLATVCRAVQHAHDRGFIHRDLKPSNVLVVEHEGQMMPKIIDFGIAKATAVDAGNTLHTRADQVLGTPEYMSPEQAISGGLDVDIRSDVYSLGAILYELLCGELPFDSQRLRRATRHELERIMQDELPTTPSLRLSLVGKDVVAARGGARGTVQRRITGELDWITLKALAKQREHRYPSALALAEDLERWLRHQPVLAAPPGAGYLLRKFARRHRVALTAAAAVFLSLVIGLVLSLRATGQAVRAEHRTALALNDMRVFYDLARDTVGGLVDAADQSLVDLPQAEPVRRQMLADAIRFYAALQACKPTDLSLRIDLLAASERIGVLQRRLGQTAEGLATLEQCVADLDDLLSATKDGAVVVLDKAQLSGLAAGDIEAKFAAAKARKIDGKWVSDLAELQQERRVLQLSIQARNSLSRALSAGGRGAEAKAMLRAALGEVALTRHLPEPPDLDPVEANLLCNLAIESDDDLTGSLELFQRALAVHERATTKQPKDLDLLRNQVRCQGLFAEALTRADRLAAAAAELTAAVERLQALPPDASAKLREAEGTVQVQFAQVLRRLGRGAEAAVAEHLAIDRFERLAAEHPAVPSHQDQLAAGWHFLSQLAEDEAQLDKAIDCIAKAVAVREQLVRQNPQDYRQQLRFVRSLKTQADYEIRAWQQSGGKTGDPQTTLARAALVTDALREHHGNDVEVVVVFAAVHGALASVREAQSQPREALQEHLAVQTLLEEQLVRTPNNAEVHHHLACVQSNLVYCYYRTQDWPAAIEAGEAGREHLQRGLALDARHRGLLECAPQLLVRLAAVHFGAGDAVAGLAVMRQMVELPAFSADTHETGVITFGQYIVNQQTMADREALLEEAERHLRAVLAARGPLAQALARSKEQSSASHHASRLRDLDLRIILAAVCGQREDLVGKAQALDEGMQLAATLPDLAIDRLRDLYGQAAQNLLQRGELDSAMARAEELLAKGTPNANTCYITAAVAAGCAAKVPAGEAGAARREAFAARAVAILQQGLAAKLPKRALADGDFEALRGRADFEALRK